MTRTAGRFIFNSNLNGWVPVFGGTQRRQPSFDVLTATAHHLQDELIAGRLRSKQILEEYYGTICTHNEYLNVVYVLAPGAMKRAQEMDVKRSNGEFLGPLHGIPILVKAPDIQSNTFRHSPLGDGQPQLSRGVGLHDGWSSIAEQCVSAYVRGGFDPADGTRGHKCK
ncbi:hypothetical protein DL98DRAFT_596563 [Cadophora sp. DSE1049]|nr:hypothetical protein DL98DRAFT_596563 [Cadophora sp. DSE1049]